ncbi:putative transcriptional regulator [Nitrosomonas sp. Nm51]|uniref:YqgE/AlgH family protein n=1 Tax=Nitrosomonas sp. Nm51 TaxID=133720 RepID=UPI0008D88DF9|nr:YqgE/AlgH family protein [Nitrosomonas sp. Nm51]SER30734.1 putative transcriptional regulator [Nitrosomonas sp. Nm51]
MENINLTHHFLIAMPAMENSFFSKTVTYVCEHNERGALGLVINRPMELSMISLFKQLGIVTKDPLCHESSVLFGGPVQVDCGFVLHRPVGQWQSTLTINEKLGLTTSLDILKAIAEAEGPDQMLVAMGYAGWAAGQLEQEMAQNAWLSVPASVHVIFDLPSEERLPAAMELLGVDYTRLSNDVGHA